MYSNKLYTPLRYPGGKARLRALIAEVIARKRPSAVVTTLSPTPVAAGVALECYSTSMSAKST